MKLSLQNHSSFFVLFSYHISKIKMDKKSLVLSSHGLQNIVKDETEFIFIFGNVKICINNIFAEFVSPIVSQLHYSDPTIQEFDIKWNENLNTCINSLSIEEIITEDIISLFYDLSSGKTITLNEEQNLKMRIISILIGNDELFDQLCKLFSIEINQTNIDRYLTELQTYEYLSQITNQNEFNFTNIIDLISSQFYLIEEARLLKLPKRILYLIIENEKLKISNEDKLFDFIKSIFMNANDDEENYRIIDFLELIHLNYMSDEKICELIQFLRPCEVTSSLWNNFSHLFITKKSLREQNTNRYDKPFQNQIEFDGNESNAFNGIVHFMSNEIRGNVSDKGIIIATSSSANRSDVSARNAVDIINSSSYFFSGDKENSWIKYDFTSRKVIPSHYSIRSYPSSSGSEHLRNWVIEGSNDDTHWELLDSKSGVSCLNSRNAFHTFEIEDKKKAKEGFRFIRLRQIGKNASGTFNLSLSALEYFGKII